MSALNHSNHINKKKIVVGIMLLGMALGALFIRKFILDDFFYVGTIEATRIDLSSRLASVIKEFHFNEGDTVKVGDELVTLDCSDVDITRRYAISTFKRTEKLLQSGGIPRESYDLALKNKQEADLKWSWCQIGSPINGTVLTKFMDDNEWVIPGTKLMSIADLKNVWAYIYVEQPMLSLIKIGMPVEGLIPEYSNKKFAGKIIKINNEAEFTPKNVQTREERSRLVFGIKIQFENNEQVLKPGMSIEVNLPKI